MHSHVFTLQVMLLLLTEQQQLGKGEPHPKKELRQRTAGGCDSNGFPPGVKVFSNSIMLHRDLSFLPSSAMGFSRPAPDLPCLKTPLGFQLGQSLKVRVPVSKGFRNQESRSK